MINAQERFADVLNSNGKISEISDNDDYPNDYVKIQFEFDYFGNLMDELALNPNGIVILTPIKDCSSSAAFIRVRSYAVLVSNHLPLPWKSYS
jgi:hypothetical protein